LTEKPVFYDAKGQRRRRTTTLSATIGITIMVLVTVAILSLVLLPFIPGLPGNTAVAFRSTHPPLIGPRGDEVRQTGFLLAKAHKVAKALQLKDQIRDAKAKHQPLPKIGGGAIVAAFIMPEDPTGTNSLRQNAKKLTHVMPDWLHLTPDGQGLDLRDFDPDINPENTEIINTAEQEGILEYPILNNFGETDFDKRRVELLLASPTAQENLTNKLVQWLIANKCEGVNIDFEELSDHDFKMLPPFLKSLSATFHKYNLGVSFDLEESQIPNATPIADNVDFIVLMDYDEHAETSGAGPISSIDWYTDNISKALDMIPADKLVVGMGTYGYDWDTDKKGSLGQTVSYQEAVTMAQDSKSDVPPSQRISFDGDNLNAYYNYVDDIGHHHSVWMLDGPSNYNEYEVANESGVRGTAVWSLGTEDPTIWNFMDVRLKAIPKPVDALKTITFSYEPYHTGEGEILNCPPGFDKPRPGQREIEVDKDSGLVTGSKYVTYPRPIEIVHHGKNPTKIALTFDDGPSTPWSADILDTLEALKVPGTFFVIGENAVSHPGALRREYDDGDEIGSHSYTHPNMGVVSDTRDRIEFEATQRAIQSIIGRSTLLFRPPYNADSEPESVEEVRPVAMASALGYYTIGESIDPQDWSLQDPTRTGGVRNRSSQEIADLVVQGVHQHKGNVILLHDGGGDRRLTVGALKILVPKLQAEGFQFVTVSGLMNKTRDDVMPELTSKDLLLLPFDKIVVYGIYFLSTFFVIAFLVAIGLGIARIMLVTPMALVAAKRNKPPLPTLGDEPMVSVIIAAYNEESVIVRTVQSVLGSFYKNMEVIVVDDGSKDNTLSVVTEAFADNPQVTVMHQENGGKASALNYGMGGSKGEFHVYLDADTILSSDAIFKLVRHFSDPKVGAVAGNVKVGNRVNTLTRLQAVEYIAAQNLDRRAYSLINAMTVVPGAIGAWRRTAVESVGGYSSDTLAEDMDLTWRVRLAGWRFENEAEAIAYTEAPENLKSFFKQRFRWAFGTLQCLFKHRRALGRHGWFGRAVLPALWIFQVFMQIIAPFVDIQLVYSVVALAIAWAGNDVQTGDWRPLPDAAQTVAVIGFMYALFFGIELVSALIAFRLDREKKSLLWWLFLQRFFYRQVMYAVVWKALWTAVRGARTGWGKFERMGTVSAGKSDSSEKVLVGKNK
jgi:poly-beta-1,6 N-acetyl-D-glucosamine synthase